MRRTSSVLALLVLAGSACSSHEQPLLIGAVYPMKGGQASGGASEYHGVQLAAEYVNARAGVAGRRVEVRLAAADTSDQAARAVATLARAGVPVVIGSHGSTIARPASQAATEKGLVYWETGAIGVLQMGSSTPGALAFRFAPTGASLGRNAVRFASDILLPKLGEDARELRYAVTYVDDEYGRSVGLGAAAELRASGIEPAAMLPYKVETLDADRLALDVKRARADVLFVAAYLEDGIATREALVRHRVPLVASVGTSSSYCMHEFGVRLGNMALGLFASDKPDGDVLHPEKLAGDAANALRWARAEYEQRYGHTMTSHALTGFAGAWALFDKVLPEADAATAAGIARAATKVKVPEGGLPNGSGLDFSASERGPLDNLRATSVIWEWVKPQTRAIVWPPAFATSPVVPLRIA